MTLAETLAALAAAVVCTLAIAPAASQPSPGATAVSGPAALCMKNGATVMSETLPNGTKHDVCQFPNGSRIDAETYFRNKHRLH